MSIQIAKTITACGVKSADEAPQDTVPAEQLTEDMERPEELVGSTYKIAPPTEDHALYITINDVVLNAGTEHEVRRPFEIFINSKSIEQHQWVVAMTRVMSAVFRKGGDIAFLVDELKDIFDPKGGYWKPGGKFMPSLIAEIGEAIERHLTKIGLIEPPELDEHQKALIEEKRAQYEAAQRSTEQVTDSGSGQFPKGAQMCGKCHEQAVVMMDGCATCLNCSDSKCG